MNLQKYFSKKIAWIIICLLILATPWVADLALLMYGSSAKTLAAFIVPSHDEVLISGLLLTIFISNVFVTALIFCRPFSTYPTNSTLVSNNNIDVACFTLLPVFFILNLIFLSDALQQGVNDALLAFRSQAQKIGFFGYFVMIFSPIALAVTWRRNKNAVNYSLLLLVSFTNLITGFRVLLVNGLVLIFIYNYKHFLKSSVKRIFLFILLLSISLVIYEFFRSALESGDALLSDTDRSVFDSLARSVPIRYISIALRENLVLDWPVLIGILTEPFSIIISQIFPNAIVESASLLVSEPMARSYLIWRGTPDAEASGFSVHVLAQAFLFDGIVGVILFSWLIGILLGLGVKLIRAQGNINRMLGTLFLTFVIGCTEAFSEAWKLLCYWVVFLAILILFARILGILKLRAVR